MTIRMKAIRRIYIVVWLLLMVATSEAKTIKVLAIGNSFSQDAVEHYLYELAAAQGDSLIIGNAYIPGCPIDRHYDNLKTGKAEYEYNKVTHGVLASHKGVSLLRIIRDEQWDIITLQQASPLSGIASSYTNLGRMKQLVQSYTTNLHVQFAWHMTWAYAHSYTGKEFEHYSNDQRRMYEDIVHVMQQVLPSVGLTRVIPTGTAVQLGRYIMGDVLNRDGRHLSLTVGRYLAACTWCEFLTGKIVDGNRYRPESISEEEARLCQQAAHEAIFMQHHHRYAIL